MRNWETAFFISACTATAACGVSTDGIAIRAIPDPAAKVRQGDASLGEARAQLALGNTGLALEAFRKVIRTQGDSAGALAGVAACYAAMGRYDIAQKNYEAALALAPHDPQLLLGLARVLERLGKNLEATEARDEVQQLVTVSPTRPVLLTPEAPPTSPVDIARPGGFTEAPRTSDALQKPPEAQVQALASAPVRPDPHATARLTSTVTVELPPARPVEQRLGRDMSSPPPAITQFGSTIGQARGSARIAAGGSKRLASSPPRLERLSRTEVALVTTSSPVWRAQVVSRTPLSTTVRWVPVQAATARPNIRLLNAARNAGLAARSRHALLDLGWRRIQIGDAQQIRATSLVIYPASRSALGRSLAAQFGCASQKGEGDTLVVLLGRDIARLNPVGA